jgi:hypothetical protein
MNDTPIAKVPANNLIVDCMSITMSFIKTIKNSGCRIDPWGTPALMKPQSDDTKEVRAIFCDISKAFDRDWHRGLQKKLELIGIMGSLLDWVQNYLSGRKQRVVINCVSSDWESPFVNPDWLFVIILFSSR